jgi:hypothetical protein
MRGNFHVAPKVSACGGERLALILAFSPKEKESAFARSPVCRKHPTTSATVIQQGSDKFSFSWGRRPG